VEVTLATHKSSEKRARQAVKISARNVQTKNSVRTFEKKVRAAITAKDAKTAQTLLKEYTSKAGKAAQKGVIHDKAHARTISRLSAQVSALK
jgi:small subunit ribosomal protein S20